MMRRHKNPVVLIARRFPNKAVAAASTLEVLQVEYLPIQIGSLHGSAAPSSMAASESSFEVNQTRKEGA